MLLRGIVFRLPKQSQYPPSKEWCIAGLTEHEARWRLAWDVGRLIDDSPETCKLGYLPFCFTPPAVDYFTKHGTKVDRWLLYNKCRLSKYWGKAWSAIPIVVRKDAVTKAERLKPRPSLNKFAKIPHKRPFLDIGTTGESSSEVCVDAFQRIFKVDFSQCYSRADTITKFRKWLKECENRLGIKVGRNRFTDLCKYIGLYQLYRVNSSHEDAIYTCECACNLIPGQKLKISKTLEDENPAIDPIILACVVPKSERIWNDSFKKANLILSEKSLAPN